MTPKICVSILPKNSQEAISLIKNAEGAKADLIEVRLDLFDVNTNLREIVDCASTPLIGTHKLASEKGFSSATQEQKQEMLGSAAQSGFEYVDIDLSSPNLQGVIDKFRDTSAKLIVSYHKFDGTLSRAALERILEQEIAASASVCKVVVSARKIDDNLAILNFVASHSGKVKLVSHCMGEAGKISRLLSPMFGSFFAYASLEKGDETAAGQMTINEMRTFYDLLGAK